jgi:hypothetical protein
MIKNLNQLKKALVLGVEFEIVLHIQKGCIGQVRRVTKANTTGIYSVVPAEPNSKISRGNNGLGSFLSWESAKRWTFDAEGVCAQYSDYPRTTNEILIAFKLLDAGKTDRKMISGVENAELS